MGRNSGRCLCGQVSYEGHGLRGHIHVCHCTDCRRWSGGPSMNVSFSEGLTINGPENVNWFRSSDWAERGSCRTCGSTLFYRMRDNPSFLNVSVGSLDDDRDAGPIAEHIFIDSKPDFYDFADNAPRITGAEIIARFNSAPESGS